MTQSHVTVQVPQTLEELKGAKLKDLQAIVKILKAEDSDCLPQVNTKSKKEPLVKALTVYMGFDESVAEEIEMAVQNEIIEMVHNTDDAHENPELEMQDVMDLGESTPPLTDDLFAEIEDMRTPKPEQVEVSGEIGQLSTDIPENMFDFLDVPKAEENSTGDQDVDDILAELGLDQVDGLQAPGNEQQAEDGNAQAEVPPTTESEKKPRGKRATIPMDAPLPIRQYENLILGVYGNILEEREEPFPAGHKYEGMTHEEIKLERFNAKAHEVFRNTKGHINLLYTQAGSTYLIVLNKADGTVDPILEVSNKGRGHLRGKQIANFLQVAYNEKNDQAVIKAEEYLDLASKIELLPLQIGAEA